MGEVVVVGGVGVSSLQRDTIKKVVSESLKVKQWRRLRRWRRRGDSQGSAVSSLTVAQVLVSSSAADQSGDEWMPVFNSAG